MIFFFSKNNFINLHPPGISPPPPPPPPVNGNADGVVLLKILCGALVESTQKSKNEFKQNVIFRTKIIHPPGISGDTGDLARGGDFARAR